MRVILLLMSVHNPITGWIAVLIVLNGELEVIGRIIPLFMRYFPFPQSEEYVLLLLLLLFTLRMYFSISKSGEGFMEDHLKLNYETECPEMN